MTPSCCRQTHDTGACLKPGGGGKQVSAGAGGVPTSLVVGAGSRDPQGSTPRGGLLVLQLHNELVAEAYSSGMSLGCISRRPASRCTMLWHLYATTTCRPLSCVKHMKCIKQYMKDSWGIIQSIPLSRAVQGRVVKRTWMQMLRTLLQRVFRHRSKWNIQLDVMWPLSRGTDRLSQQHCTWPGPLVAFF